MSDATMFLAQVISLLYIAVGLGFLFSGEYYRKTLPKIFDDAGMLYLGGFMAVIVGYAMIQVHNVWVKDWTVIITLIGWIALIKGFLLLVFPGSVKVFKPLYKSKNLSKWSIIPLVLGLVLGYYSFIA